MPQLFSRAIKQFALLLITVAILQGCASDKECWEPDFTDRSAHGKNSQTVKKR